MTYILLLAQICLVYPIIWEANSSIYDKMSSFQKLKKIKKSTDQILRKICHRPMDREMDAQTAMILKGPFHKDGGFIKFS